MRGSNSLTGSLKAYAGAVRTARTIRNLPRTLTHEEAFAFTQRGAWAGGDSLSANQKPEEILWLLELLQAEPPATVLEIGLDRGGTLFLWTRVATSDALLVSVDLHQVEGRLGRHSPFALVRRSFARDRQRIELLGGVDSRREQTRTSVERLLRGHPVDFLFIDGDHRYESVKRDFELYTPLVRPGGLVALHDVSPRTTRDTEGTARFWSELKRELETDEQIASGSPGYGIGVVRIGDARP